MMPGGKQQFPGTQRPSLPSFVWQEPGSSWRQAAGLSTEKAGRRREECVFASRWVRDRKVSLKTGNGVSFCGFRVTLWEGMTTLERNGPLAP